MEEDVGRAEVVGGSVVDTGATVVGLVVLLRCDVSVHLMVNFFTVVGESFSVLASGVVVSRVVGLIVDFFE